MIEVNIPKVGMSTVEVDVTDIVAPVGSSVEEGDPLLTLSTDKVDLDVESPATGTVAEVLVEIDGVYPVGFVAMRIDPA